MKAHNAVLLLTLLGAVPVFAQQDERVGVVHFATSCAATVQPSFNRGVALLHDFWYAEAKHQFEQITKADPDCPIARWGIAMSDFHQIWNRPNEKVMASGWEELQKAIALKPKTERETDYIGALATFFKPGKDEFQVRIEAYAMAMSQVAARYPDDIDAGAFYALALIAESAPDDTSLRSLHQALAVLQPLFVKDPNHPGVVHYIIHACDTPSLASQGLAAAEAYGNIAPSAPHAVHMPGHIFARLGMWQPDIEVNEKSVAASQRAEARHMSGAMDQFHAYEFLLYAYLQSGQEARAKEVIAKTTALSESMKAMPDMDMDNMKGYKGELNAFYYLEMGNWNAAALLEPEAKKPESEVVTYWARVIANGHMRKARAANDDLITYDSLIEQMKKGKSAFFATSTSAKIMRGEMAAWAMFAEGEKSNALDSLRAAADLQDKVGQGEVDIPAREMLADMLMLAKHPDQALLEYDRALALSPNRFNALFHAGLAAEALHNKADARKYYTALLKATNNGAESTRPEVALAKAWVAGNQIALF